MKLITFFTILISCFGLKLCLSQCYFYDIYPSKVGNDAMFGTSITFLNEQKLLSVGITSITFSDELFYLNYHGDCGDTINQNIFNFQPVGGETPRSITKLQSGNILIQGTIFDTIEQARDNFILEIDTLGQVVNYKIVDAGYNDFGRSVKQAKNGSLSIGGVYWSDGGLFLVNTDSAGNINWVKDYELLRQNRLQSIDLTIDSGYILGGYISKPNFETDLFLIKTDKDGNELWSKTYGDINVEERNGYVATTLDGGFILASNKTPYPGPSFINQAKCYILKTDSAGIIEWQREYNLLPNHPDYLKKVIALPDSTYLFLGTIDDTIQNVPQVLLLKTDKNGNKLWHRSYSYYGGQTHNYGEDFSISANGDIAVTGYIIPTGGYNDMFVLKTDSCGYLESDSIDVQFTYEQTNLYEITFTNQSQHYCTPLWYFGDGDSLYSQSPIHSYPDTGTYTVTLIVRAGNSLDTITQQVVVSGTVGMSQQTADDRRQVRVYPNPASNELHIEVENAKYKIQNITIYDITGKAEDIVYKTAKETAMVMNIDKLATGIYFCHVLLADGQMVVRTVVKN